MFYNPLNVYNEIGQTLLKAADYIEEYGHHKGGYEWVSNSVCIFGAIGMVTVGTACIYSAKGKQTEKNLAVRCERALYDKVRAHVPRWNDAAERTKEDVIGLLRKVAEEHKLVKV